MPLYFFHVQHGPERKPDTRGVALPNLAGVREEAAKVAAALLRELKPSFWEGHDWTVDVQDEHGLTLLYVIVAAVEAPAIPKSRPLTAAHLETRR